MRIIPQQRRARLAHRHFLTPRNRSESPEEVAEALVGLHATEAATVLLSARARLREPSLADLERALYVDRTLVRMHGMRRTLFVVTEDLVPVVHFASAETVASRERAMLLKQLAAGGVEADDAWLTAAQEKALAALRELGEAGVAEVTEAVPDLRATYTLSPGKRYESRLRVGGPVLRLLAMEGRIRRTRPVGGWTSSHFRYTIAPPLAPLEPAEARAELVRRWLACYGPGTEADIKWWSGLTLAQVRAALSEVGAEQVELAEGTGFVLSGDVDDEPEPEPEPESWAALLPALDPATMGWKHRDWYTDPAHRPLLFDSAGNAGPTVWWNGEIIGAWAQRGDGAVVHRLLTDRGSEARRAVADEAARLQEWLTTHNLVVRFPAPLTKELTG